MGWLSKHGGKVDEATDTVAQLARIGTSGQHLNNAERDTHRLVHRIGQSLGATIEFKDVRLINPSTLEEYVGQLPMILPHQMCLALWARGEAVFRQCLLGKLSDTQVREYWDHHELNAGRFSEHPSRHWNTRGRIASVGSYGDEVQAYRNSECGVVSVLGWTSELAFKADPLLRYFAISVWSEHHQSPHTYTDAITYVVESFRALQSQVWPWTSEGYLVSFSFAQGDLKWLNEQMGVHNYRQNEFCSRCFCKKNAENVFDTLPYFPHNSEHFGRREFSAQDLERQFSPLFSLSLTMDRVQHDVAHSQLLGTGKVANGSALIHMCEAGWFGNMGGPGQYKDRLAPVLRRAHRDFLLWKKFHGKQCSQPRFTPARCNRKVQTSCSAL